MPPGASGQTRDAAASVEGGGKCGEKAQSRGYQVTVWPGSYEVFRPRCWQGEYKSLFHQLLFQGDRLRAGRCSNEPAELAPTRRREGSWDGTD